VRFTSSELLKNNRISNPQIGPVEKTRGKRLTLASSLSHFMDVDDSSDNLLVELNGIEPMTSCLQSRRSPN
jgi:hypothetical protein